ncbi:putative damage-inducible protein DinB (forms a four-helix bundle) [Prauserella aidingensis]|uniref:DinB family protein n=1 Tax=Prauserella aidingensis TaxID=387890 RepID=UPI0020A312C8|nr:DinB family protein [Prauserella aidingensis]MCP2251679.1 putative damage-inducible protein DinB (forms a four-helix bundle) [Prauserella aidingensis]
MSDMDTVDEQGRTEPPLEGGEEDQLLGFLDYQRQTLEWKCSRLGDEALRATTSASAMTLGGLLKHMAFVEDHWFSRRLHGLPAELPWDAVDWARDPDWDWRSAADDTPEQLLALWKDAVDASRRLTAEALADGGFERLADAPWPDGRAPNLRWIVLHMIEEYARHNGHADLLRESIDGETGE